MFTRIVVGIDGSRAAASAARAAITLASWNSAEVHLISIVEELPSYISAREEIAREEAEAQHYFRSIHARLHKEATRYGVAITAQVVLLGHEVRQIITYLVQVRADLLVIGHAGHSAVWDTALGATASQLLRHAPCSMLITRASAPAAFLARPAVALDGSPIGWEAYAVALDLAQHARHPLQVLSVIEKPHAALSTTPPTLAPNTTHTSWQTFLPGVQARAAARAAAAGTPIEISTRTGSASETLVAAARELASDLLIIGATGHERPWSQTTGGTAMKVAEEAPCAVLVVRPPVRGILVRDVMTPVPFTAYPDTPLAEILAALLDGKARLIPVISSDGTLCGILTLGYLLRHLDPALATHLTTKRAPTHAHIHLDRLVAGKVAHDSMETRPFVLQPDVPLKVAGRYLATHHITRVPVVETSGHLAGMLSEREVVAALITPQTQAGEAEPLSPTGEAAEEATSEPLTAGMGASRQLSLVVESASLDEVMSALQATPHRLAVVVTHDGHLRGIIDERALLKYALPDEESGRGALLLRLLSLSPAQLLTIIRGHPTEPLTAAALMRPALALPAEMPVAEALARLLDQHGDVGVVVTPQHQPAGLLWRYTALHALVRG